MIEFIGKPAYKTREDSKGMKLKLGAVPYEGSMPITQRATRS